MPNNNNQNGVGPGQRISDFQPVLEPNTMRPSPGTDSPFIVTHPPTQNFRDFKLSPKTDQPLWLPFDVNLSPGQSMLCDPQSEFPEYWMVSIRPGTGIRVSVFPSSFSTGVPYRIAGGGSLRIPGTSEFLTVLNETGSAACQGTVIAGRYYENMFITPGQVS